VTERLGPEQNTSRSNKLEILFHTAVFKAVGISRRSSVIQYSSKSWSTLRRIYSFHQAGSHRTEGRGGRRRKRKRGKGEGERGSHHRE